MTRLPDPLEARIRRLEEGPRGRGGSIPGFEALHPRNRRSGEWRDKPGAVAVERPAGASPQVGNLYQMGTTAPPGWPGDKKWLAQFEIVGVTSAGAYTMQPVGGDASQRFQADHAMIAKLDPSKPRGLPRIPGGADIPPGFHPPAPMGPMFG